MNEVYNQKLLSLINSKNDAMDQYHQELEKINSIYVPSINRLKKHIKNNFLSIVIIILIYFLILIIFELAKIKGLLIPITSGVCSSIVLLLIVIEVIYLLKNKKSNRLYQKEMNIVSNYFKEALKYEDEASNYIPLVIGLFEKKEEANIKLINKDSQGYNNYIKQLSDEYCMIIKERIIGMGMKLDRSSFFEYYLIWKEKNNDEYIEVNMESRKALVERKSSNR